MELVILYGVLLGLLIFSIDKALNKFFRIDFRYAQLFVWLFMIYSLIIIRFDRIGWVALGYFIMFLIGLIGTAVNWLLVLAFKFWKRKKN